MIVRLGSGRGRGGGGGGGGGVAGGGGGGGGAYLQTIALSIIGMEKLQQACALAN